MGGEGRYNNMTVKDVAVGAFRHRVRIYFLCNLSMLFNLSEPHFPHSSTGIKNLIYTS